MFSLTIRNIKFEYRSRYANRLTDMTARRLNCTTKVFVFINIIISLIVLQKKKKRKKYRRENQKVIGDIFSVKFKHDFKECKVIKYHLEQGFL